MPVLTTVLKMRTITTRLFNSNSKMPSSVRNLMLTTKHFNTTTTSRVPTPSNNTTREIKIRK